MTAYKLRLKGIKIRSVGEHKVSYGQGKNRSRDTDYTAEKNVVYEIAYIASDGVEFATIPTGRESISLLYFMSFDAFTKFSAATTRTKRPLII